MQKMPFPGVYLRLAASRCVAELLRAGIESDQKATGLLSFHYALL